MSDKPKPQVYEIPFAIEGYTKIEASSPEEAREKFDRLTAEELIADGYSDIQVFEPKLLIED